jgi:hypothetical protein
VGGKGIVRIKGDGAPGLSDILLENLPGESGGRAIISLPPPMAQLRSCRRGQSLTAVLEFSRDMAGPGRHGEDSAAVPLAFMGLSLSPDLGFRARWIGPRALEISSGPLGDDGGYEDRAMDRGFTLGGLDLTSLSGETFTGAPLAALPPARALPDGSIVLDSFRLLEFSRQGFSEDGRIVFGMFFNKAVRLEDLNDSSKAVLGIVQREGAPPPEASFGEVYLRDKGALEGREFYVDAAAPNGSFVELALTGLPAASGRGGLSTSSRAQAVNVFGVESLGIGMDPSWPYAAYFRVGFLKPLENEGPEALFELQGGIPFKLAEERRGVYRLYADLPMGEEARLTLRRGLMTRDGVLAHDTVLKATARPSDNVRLEFVPGGRYLASGGGGGGSPPSLALRGANADLVAIDAWRVHDGNIPALLSLGSWDARDKARAASQFSEHVLSRTAETNAEPGRPFERLVGIAGFTGGRKGLYIFRATPLTRAGDGTLLISGTEVPYSRDAGPLDHWQWESSPGRHFALAETDVGLSARRLGGKTLVWATSLRSGLPAPGATVRLYDPAGRIVLLGETDSKGLLEASHQGQDVRFLTASVYGDTSYLMLEDRPRAAAGAPGGFRESPFSSQGGFAPQGEGEPFPEGPYTVQLLTPRNLWRPGESPAFKGIVREGLEAPKGPFPLEWEARGPDGRAVKGGVAEVSAFGGFDFSFTLPPSARSGGWTALVRAPGSREPLQSLPFTVLDFQPGRLDVSLRPSGGEALGADGAARLDLEAAFVFGARASGLGYTYEAVLRPLALAPPGLEGFDFDSGLPCGPCGAVAASGSGSLDRGGRALIELQLPRLGGGAPQALELEATAEVTGPSGRGASASSRQRLLPYGMAGGV